MLADMAIGVESSRLCYMKAAWMADQVRHLKGRCRPGLKMRRNGNVLPSVKWQTEITNLSGKIITVRKMR